MINPSITESISQRLASQIADEHISSICMNLSRTKAEILYRRIVIEDDFKQIAKDMNIPQKKVEAHYYNTIRTIRRELRRAL